MEPRKLNVFIAFFPYGGNGGVSSEHPSIRDWLATTLLAASKDERIAHFDWQDFCDTPITMTRNEAVEVARKRGADILVMIDSDQHIDMYVGVDPTATKFFDTAFDFIYAKYEKGPHVVAAPYCGPPPHENVYMFQWGNSESLTPDATFECKQFGREEAGLRTGIEPVACAPTGVIMYDMRLFREGDKAILEHPYFDYEWIGDGKKCKHCNQYKPGPRAEKASTEDVVNTRDLALIGHMKLGYNPLHCAWPCWAGHYKPKCVGKPIPTTIDQVNERYVNAVKRGNRQGEKVIVVGDKPLTTFTLPPELNGHAKPDDLVAKKARIAERLAEPEPPQPGVSDMDEYESATWNEIRQTARTLAVAKGISFMDAISEAIDLCRKPAPPAVKPQATESLIDLELTENDLPQPNAPSVIGYGSHTSDNVKRTVIRQPYIDDRTLGEVEVVGLMDSEEFLRASTNEPNYCWGRKLN